MAWTSAHVLRVEGGAGPAHEGWFEDVSTLTVLQKPSLVQIHLLTWSLEVQSH